MSTERKRLEQQRDQILHDIVDLDRQVEDGEIPESAAERLRAEYEASAAEVLEALEQTAVRDQGVVAKKRPAIVRRGAYVVGALIAVFAAGVLLPHYVAERPKEGFVTGNEVNQPQSAPGDTAQPPATAGNTGQPPPAPPRDLSEVTNEEMEAVIAQNPGIVGMRSALAERYVEQGRFDKAAEHYAVALKQAPQNPKVQAGAGRLLVALDKPEQAVLYADRALEIAPSSAEGLLLRAEIRAAGFGDSQAARPILQRLTARSGLDPDVRRRSEELLQRIDRGQPAGDR